MVKYAIHFLRFSSLIDISHDRFLSGKNGGKKHTSSVKGEILEKNHPRKSSQVKI